MKEPEKTEAEDVGSGKKTNEMTHEWLSFQ
jgi:hypothetical protein